MKFVAMLALLAWSAVSSFGQAPPFYTAYIYTKEFHPPALVKEFPTPRRKPTSCRRRAGRIL
jgi:hypothetical protein